MPPEWDLEHPFHSLNGMRIGGDGVALVAEHTLGLADGLRQGPKTGEDFFKLTHYHFFAFFAVNDSPRSLPFCYQMPLTRRYQEHNRQA